MRLFSLMICFVFAVACSSTGIVTDGDRGLEDQSLKGVTLVAEKIPPVVQADKELAALKAAAALNPLTATPEILAAATMKFKASMDELVGISLSAIPIVQANLAQLQKNHGPPAKPEPFSPAASKKLQEQSQQEHSLPGWLYVLFGVGGSATIMAFAGKISQYAPLVASALEWIPGIGPWIGVARAAIQGIATVRNSIQNGAPPGTPAPAKPLSEEDLLQPIAKAAEQFGVERLLKNLPNAIEERIFGKRL